MRRNTGALIALGLLGSWLPHARRANFVHVAITTSEPARFRAIWHPRAGERGTVRTEGPRSTIELFGRAPVDSLRRWRDSTARDTVFGVTPADFAIDMSAGTVIVESVNNETLRARVQLTPARGVVVEGSGRMIRIDCDGVTPRVAAFARQP